MASYPYSSSSTPLQRPHNNGYYMETSSFYGMHVPSNIRRRKRSPQNMNWAKFATKCVLASPLIVLMLWSVAVIAHSSSASSSPQQDIASVSSNARTSTSTKVVVVEPSHQGGNQKSAKSSLPVYVPLGQQQRSSASSTVVVRPRPHPQGQRDENTRTQGGNAMTTTESGGNVMQNGLGGMMNTQNDNDIAVRQMATGNAQNGMQNGVVMMNTQGGNAMMTRTRTTPYGNAMTQQQQGVMATTTTLGDNVIDAVEIAENVLANTMGSVAMSNTQGSQQRMAAQENEDVYPAKRTRILYYDPAVGTETVYDADGTPILLSSLQTDTTEIYLEKPSSFGMTKNTLEQTPNMETLEYEWGESQAQDQMIIISTVATMALLVGALSARRMRSRQFLSSCIENESLEDEVAYDTAYTTNGYDTFGGGPWKGDLEKFDV